MQETRERAITVLGILQNYYAGARYRNKRIPTPYPSWHPVMINRKNATYSRIIPPCEKLGIKLWLTECTDVIAGERTDKFIYKPEVVKHSLDAQKWDAVIVFGSHAKHVLDIIRKEDLYLDMYRYFYMPHPVSYMWRKQSYLDMLDAISRIA